MNEKPTIEVVMIVKNEKDVLQRCLESVKSADFITIVDTGSIDNTIEIARKYTDRVYDDFTWCDSFEKARNHALKKATGDWVLSIDADEYCHDFNKVREAVDLAIAKEALAVEVTMIAEDSSKQEFFFPRLFKRCDQVWWEGAIHNHLSVAGEKLGDVRITFGYSPAHQLDPNRAFRILKKEVDEHGNGREMFYLGREYWYRQQYEECVKVLGGYVQKSKYLPEKAEAFYLMSRCYWCMAMGDDARDACAQAVIINPNFKEAVLFMATLSGDGTGNDTWQKNADQWINMAKTADNSNVLFKRVV